MSALVVAAAALTLAWPAHSVEALNTRHFRIHLDPASGLDGPRLGADLEAVRREYVAVVGGLVSLREGAGRLEVFAPAGPEGRRRLALDRPDLALAPLLYPGPVRLQGSPAILVDGAGMLGGGDLPALFHGVVHLCHDALLYEPGAAGQWWVREGLAAYLTQTPYRPADGFRLGKVRTSSGYIDDISPTGRVSDTLSFAEEPKQALDMLREDYKHGRQVPLATLLDHPGNRSWPDAATRDRAALQSWVLLHFLLHGPEPELRQRFARYLVVERRDEGGAEAFRSLVSGDLARLEPLLFRHARQMD